MLLKGCLEEKSPNPAKVTGKRETAWCLCAFQPSSSPAFCREKLNTFVGALSLPAHHSKMLDDTDQNHHQTGQKTGAMALSSLTLAPGHPQTTAGMNEQTFQPSELQREGSQGQQCECGHSPWAKQCHRSHVARKPYPPSPSFPFKLPHFMFVPIVSTSAEHQWVCPSQEKSCAEKKQTR